MSRKIQDVIDPLAKSNNYGGTVIVQKGGNYIFKRSYGFADRESKIEHSAQSKFFLASVSAMFTAAAVMKLIDQGKLSLDDKLSKFVPGIKNGNRMTIHILLTERSGIPRIGSQGNVNYTTLTESPQSIDDLIGHIKALNPVSEPGAKYEHSRSSYILLARVIEKVSGKRFGQFLKDEVFIPLGMKNSGHFSERDALDKIPNLAKGYVQKGVTDLSPAPVLHWSSKTGHASIYSTAEDLEKFANAALNKEFLSAESWKKLQSPHDGDNVGYGVFTSPQGTHKRFYMSGGSPGFSTFFAVYPDEKLVVIMLSNIQIFVPYFTVPTLASIVFGEPYERLNLVTPPDVDEKLAGRLRGSFKFGEDFYRPNGTVSITAEGNRLFADGGPLIPIDDGKGEFTRFIHRRYWSTLEFKKNSTGKIVGLKFDSFSGTRIE
ncbi:MAG: beta-lactamase family protein [Acidobacteriota bacterium]|nr:beta-lactamase family protein [Acidobacteriota bacterium]